MTIKKKPTLTKKLISKKTTSKSTCTCSKKTKDKKGKVCDPKRIIVEQPIPISDKDIKKDLNKPVSTKKVKTIDGKRTTATFEETPLPISGGGTAIEIDTDGIIRPDVTLGQLRISENLYFSRRARINKTTICERYRVYSCLRGFPGRRTCRLTGFRTVRCNWTSTGTISITANLTIPALYTNLVNSNSNIMSCITNNTGTIRNYVLNNIGSISQLNNTFLKNNLSRILVEAGLDYQSQLSSCLGPYMDSNSASALANGIRVRTRVNFRSFTDWVKTS